MISWEGNVDNSATNAHFCPLLSTYFAFQFTQFTNDRVVFQADQEVLSPILRMTKIEMKPQSVDDFIFKLFDIFGRKNKILKLLISVGIR